MVNDVYYMYFLQVVMLVKIYALIPTILISTDSDSDILILIFTDQYTVNKLIVFPLHVHDLCVLS